MSKEHTGNEAFLRADSAHERIDRVEGDVSTVWEHMNAVEKRPPLWATFALSGSTFLIGILVTLLGVLARITWGS